MINKGGFDYSQLMNMPGVQILNMSDFENMMPKQQQIKKKQPDEKREPVFDIHIFRFRIRSKHSLMSM